MMSLMKTNFAGPAAKHHPFTVTESPPCFTVGRKRLKCSSVFEFSAHFYASTGSKNIKLVLVTKLTKLPEEITMILMIFDKGSKFFAVDLKNKLLFASYSSIEPVTLDGWANRLCGKLFLACLSNLYQHFVVRKPWIGGHLPH